MSSPTPVPPVNAAEMRALEKALIAQGTLPETLLEQAGLGLTHALLEWLDDCQPGTAVLFAGKGHNAADGFLLLRELQARGWQVFERLTSSLDELAPLTRQSRSQVKQLASWPEPTFQPSSTAPDTPPPLPTQATRPQNFSSQAPKSPQQFAQTQAKQLHKSKQTKLKTPLLILDGLLGIGARLPIPTHLIQAIDELHLWKERGAQVIAIDVPTGLPLSFKETPAPFVEPIVRADLTITFGRAKWGLLHPEVEAFVGRLALVPLSGIEADTSLVTSARVGRSLPRRNPHWHKATAGRVAVIAGSEGMIGAAQLCAEAALRAGAGLVTLWAHESIAPVLSQRLAPELMLKSYADASQLGETLSQENYDSFAIGCGLGLHAAELLPWLSHEARPCVLDADALNALAHYPSLIIKQEQLHSTTKQYQSLQTAPFTRILTPHRGESARLLDSLGLDQSAQSQLSRAQQAQQLAEHFHATILLKGARSIIAHPISSQANSSDSPPSLQFNSTGNAGMATGGMGDCLTGIIAALLAQGMSAPEAATAAAWLHGRGAELACSRGQESHETCRASRSLDFLGVAFQEARAEALRQNEEFS